MSKLIGSWSFYKKTILIAVPIMVQNLITNLVAMIDNIMVGQIGTEQMSAVAIVNQLFFVFNLSIFGSLSGAGIFSAQFFGKEDIEGVRHTMRFKFMTATVITAIGILVFLLAGDSLVELYLLGEFRCKLLEVDFDDTCFLVTLLAEVISCLGGFRRGDLHQISENTTNAYCRKETDENL